MPNTSDKYITDNKLAAANKSPSLSKKQTVPSREDGTVGIRSTLTNMGTVSYTHLRAHETVCEPV